MTLVVLTVFTFSREQCVTTVTNSLCKTVSQASDSTTFTTIAHHKLVCCGWQRAGAPKNVSLMLISLVV